MMILALLLIPTLGAAGSWFIRRNGAPVRILVGTAVATLAATLTAVCLAQSAPGPVYFRLGSMLGADAASLFFLVLTQVVFVAVALHVPRWLAADLEYPERDGGKRLSTPFFCCGLSLFVATMTLVLLARNFGLLWVAIEATTLASAPLIAFHRSGRSLEAMWKYLLLCSVGIAFALFGTMMLSVAAAFAGGNGSLDFDQFPALAHQGWFKAAFIMLLVGYGTKMGLAPFHTWLPDDYSEAPASATLLSGGLLNCALLGVLRVMAVAPEGLDGFCGDLLIGLGLFSVLTAALFMIRQNDFKRMLAYSGVEHMGIIAIACGMGAWQAGALHVFGHTLGKSVLFLVTDALLVAYGTRQISGVTGMLGRLPKNGLLWLVGLLVLCGTPPSPLFASEYMIVRAAFTEGRWVVGGGLLLLLFVVFAGMAVGFFRMLMGHPAAVRPGAEVPAEKMTWIPAVLLGVVIAGGALALAALIGGAI